ncbi:MarR family transcriptional regulator [Lactobacillus sp. CBA3605]|uniref:MarR family winged helix-turn-helix transcriptional regulator n=1 Tax=Lactobacillus sp. CBA3605 TaxID=2099788 RepID=UPI000CFB4986|nr:MarR family transcriptional regulator [Lactobacillus sp. CBA3605]AVK62388.1 MarR family transcriptional regulator [Lactobacillus sp. CBA3605]
MESRVLRDIGTIARALDSISNVEFKAISLEKGQYLYLSRIYENPGITQKELSQLLCVDKTTTSRAIMRLIEKEIIIKTDDPTNQKNKLLWASKQGKLLYQNLEKERLYSTKVALAGLNSDEIKAIEQALSVVTHNIVENWQFVKQGNKRHY